MALAITRRDSGFGAVLALLGFFAGLAFSIRRPAVGFVLLMIIALLVLGIARRTPRIIRLTILAFAVFFLYDAIAVGIGWDWISWLTDIEGWRQELLQPNPHHLGPVPGR